MNIEKAEIVYNAISNHTIPTLGFNYDTYFAYSRNDFYPLKDHSGHKCKTVGCIGGWTIAVFDGVEALEEMPRQAAFKRARELLELSDYDARQLFLPYPDTLQVEWLSQVSQERALLHLRRFIIQKTPMKTKRPYRPRPSRAKPKVEVEKVEAELELT